MLPERADRPGAHMPFSSWRGIVGMINPTMRPGVTEEVIRLLPPGIGLIPLDEAGGLDLSPIDGAEVAKLIAQSAATPKPVIDRYNALLTPRPN